MIRFVALLLILALTPSAFAAENKESAYDRVMRTQTIKCGYFVWPPYYNLDPNTQTLTGLNKDISDTAADLLGLKIDYVQVTFGQQVQDLNSGKIDAMCGDGPWVLTSIKYMSFANPWFFAPGFVYGRQDDSRFKSIEDLNTPKITFAGFDSDFSTELAQKLFPQAKILTMPAMTDSSQLLLTLQTVKADAVITDPLTADLFEKANPGQIKKLFDKDVAVYGMGFAVRKGEQELLDTLNGATNAVMNIGFMDRILSQYDTSGTLFIPAAKLYEAKP